MSDATDAINVCIVTETFHPITGGGESQAKALALGLANCAATITVVTRRTHQTMLERENIGPVRIRRLSPSGRGQLKKWGLLVTILFALARLRRTYDVILVCGFRVVGIPAIIAAALLGKPCILKADVLGEFSGHSMRSGLARYGIGTESYLFRQAMALRALLLRKCTRFVAISSVVEQELLAGGVEPIKIARIPNSVDTKTFSVPTKSLKQALRNKLSLITSAKYAIYTGRLEDTKGLPTLLDAWKVVVQSSPTAHLLLVGAGGLGIHNCEHRLRQFVEDNGLQDHVTFCGSVNNVSDYLQAADVFVFPSEREAFGISVIEAMACELPVIATDSGGLADIVADGENALVVKPGDKDGLARAIATAFRGELATIATTGRAQVIERYSEASVIALYKNLIANGRYAYERRDD